MEFDNWQIGLATVDNNTGNLNISGAYNREDIGQAFHFMYDSGGRHSSNKGEILVAIATRQDNMYQYYPIKRIIDDYIIDFEGKLIRLNGLGNYTESFRFDDRELKIQKTSPYQRQAVTGLSIKGRNHVTNEDMYAHVFHPSDANVKLLIVADGMGGLEAGDRASHMLVDQFIGWFINTNPYALNDTEWLKNNISQTIRLRNKEVYNELIRRQGLNTGTTLALAIINSTDMVYANVGDSRICVMNDGCLRIASVDDSPNWPIGEQLTVEMLEYVRTAPQNNAITQYIGEPNVDSHVGVMPNNMYTDVFLFSDGITDCINYNTLNHIARNVDANTIFEFVKHASYGENTPGAKSKGVDDSTVVHYSVR